MLKLLAALAAVSALLILPAFADECALGSQLDHEREIGAGALASGRFTAFIDLKGDELAAFIKASNAQFSTTIPDDGSIDEGLVINVDGGTIFFGFVKGCQVGTAHLPAMPSKTSAPALLPNGLRAI